MTATLDRAPFADLAIRPEIATADAADIEARQEAFARFASVGIPTTHDEEWRFTPVRHLATTHFRSPGPSPRLAESDIAPFLLSAATFRVVIVDGRIDFGLSRLSVDDATLRVVPMAGSPIPRLEGAVSSVTDTPFAALNAALWTDGASIDASGAGNADTPIEILYLTTSAAANAVITPRTQVHVGAGSTVSLIENFVSLTAEPSFTNAVCEIVMAPNARVEHTRVQRESAAATHIGLTVVHQATASHYRSFALALGGRLSRHNLHARHDGTNVETLLYGLYLGRGDQLHDSHTAIFHNHPDCRSWEVYKGVLADRSRGVFNGKVIVSSEAQKTDAKQTNRNLLLSDDAKVNTKPQLEIFADDVKCTHGATIGRLDEQQRYYLRTRGIAGREAEAMLINAFVAEVVAEIPGSAMRETIGALVHAEMEALIG